MSSNHTMPQPRATELTTDQLDLLRGGIIIVGGKALQSGNATILSYGGASTASITFAGIAHLGGYVV